MRPLPPNSADWLSIFASSTSPETEKPFRLSGVLWAATDGHILVMANQPDRDDPQPDVSTRITKAAKGYYDQVGYKLLGEIPRNRLLTAVGPAVLPEMRACHACKGSGKVTHDCGCEHCEVKEEDCKSCQGEKHHTRQPLLRAALLFDLPINVNLLACLIRHAPPAEVYTLKKNDMIFSVTTESWLSVFIALNSDAERDRGIPELSGLVEPPVSLFARPRVEARQRPIHIAKKDSIPF